MTDKDSLIEAVTMHATRAAEKLRLDGSVCGVMQVGIRTGQHNPQEEQYSRSVTIRFPVPTADTRKLIGAGRAAIDRIYKTGPRYAKAEVALLDLVPADSVQTGLFDQGDSEKAARFMQTIDQLNRVNSRHTVFFASEGTRRDWAMKGGAENPVLHDAMGGDSGRQVTPAGAGGVSPGIETGQGVGQVSAMLDLARRRVLAALAVLLAGLRVRRGAALPSDALTPDQIRAIVEASKDEPPPSALRGGCFIGGTGRPAAQGLPSLFGPMNSRKASGKTISAKEESGALVELDMPAALRRRQS